LQLIRGPRENKRRAAQPGAIFQFADKAALDKAWNTDIKPWQMRDNVRKVAEFETFSIEGVEPK
jgi:hypothetical protein